MRVPALLPGVLRTNIKLSVSVGSIFRSAVLRDTGTTTFDMNWWAKKNRASTITLATNSLRQGLNELVTADPLD